MAEQMAHHWEHYLADCLEGKRVEPKDGKKAESWDFRSAGNSVGYLVAVWVVHSADKTADCLADHWVRYSADSKVDLMAAKKAER
eukprot:scaffold1031_cov232-Ochromonas_danica.AAC.1